MNILIVTKAAWDDRIASGNTLSNFFGEWKDSNFYCLYSRDAQPHNYVCKEYYSISPVSIVKYFFKPSKIGRRFTYVAQNECIYTTSTTEANMIDTAKRNKSFFEFVYYMAYATGLWKNSAFKKFISECHPDIVFCFGQCDPLTYRTLKYIKRNTKAKIVSYFVDDLYRARTCVFNIIQKQKNHYLKEIAQMSDICYAISQKMCDEYKVLYGKTFHLLYKGCDISPAKITVNSPIKFVYAGNLLYHRDKILGVLAQTIKQVNDGSQRARLDIYSGTSVNDEVLSALNIEGASRLHKAKPYEEIKQIMKESDIVLHVESFDEEQMKRVRLSFSTKITDCMQSGSMMMAIGPDTVASIDYASRIPGCIVINNIDNIKNTISHLLESNSIILDNAAQTNEFAKKYIDIGQVRNRLKSDFESL